MSEFSAKKVRDGTASALEAVKEANEPNRHAVTHAQWDLVKVVHTLRSGRLCERITKGQDALPFSNTKVIENGAKSKSHF